ncbi:MAG: Ribosomal RNA small subunit methyltransferase H [Candidatus Woesebacteria bacterium GW2011_GWB1_39_10]|uniref:Ribosomal RNA small subunit methyltransferase H n=3 Tax=Candidatus Woeseibacteriota TaxID=1752722 RepID=A0A0G0PQX5_9BACT|nr:MAG: Ribosomal RNA small subunit methyltransferase H [Candidatus Woesebacteria bacterium GW2011_GWB1_39_10]
MKNWLKKMNKKILASQSPGKYHESVMVDEVIKSLHVEKGLRYIDCTAGNGGHMEAILKMGGQVLGIDLDPAMLAISQKRLEKFKGFKLVQGNFVNIDRIARNNNWFPVNGILFDLGVSNIHLKDLERGFSFENPEALLDMRLNPDTQNVKGSDLLNILREDQLEDLFSISLDPGAAKWITGRVLHSRMEKPIETVGDMLEICEGLRTGKPGMSVATLPFLALRIAVNSELINLKEVLPKAFDLLKKDGRLVIISFHSGEDKIVKDFYKEKAGIGEGRMITFAPIRAGITEVDLNRRARSAKMRIVQKL